MNPPHSSSDITTKIDRKALVLNRKVARKMLRVWRKQCRKYRDVLHPKVVADIEVQLSRLEKAIHSKNSIQMAQAFARAHLIAQTYMPKKKPWVEYSLILLSAVFLALALRIFVIEPFMIPTRSMVPTLLEGDHIFVTKFSYNLRLPWHIKPLLSFSPPQRGDVVVFIFPKEDAKSFLQQKYRHTPYSPICLPQNSLTQDKDYIKRVIGLPGDRIEMIQHQLYINGHPVYRTELYRRYRSKPHHSPFVEIWAEEHLGNHRYLTISRAQSSRANFGPIVVQPNHLFVMGDNRDNSSDSRCWGQVPIELLKGKALIIWWSSSENGSRWSRFFSKIE